MRSLGINNPVIRSPIIRKVLGAIALPTIMSVLGDVPTRKESRPFLPAAGNNHGCVYRGSLAENKPFDYYLWPGERNCTPSSCAPSLPAIPTTQQEQLAYENKLTRPILNSLPTTRPDLVNFLQMAESKGQLTWLSYDQQAADFVQQNINSAKPGQDLHLLFGVFHLINGQIGFINNILDRLVGVTHLVQEYKGTSDSRFNLQTFYDRYLVTGDPKYQLQMTDTAVKGDEIDQQELADMNNTLELGKDRCLNVVFADLPSQEEKKIAEERIFRAREIYAVKRVKQRLSPTEHNVAVWVYGASHVEEEGLPTDLRAEFPGSKVIPIIMNGGTYIPTLIFDQALKELGWLEKSFILKLEGFREGKYFIHLATGGKSTNETIPGVGLPVSERDGK